MSILIRRRPDLTESDVTPEAVYRGRRTWMQQVAAGSALLNAGPALAFFGNAQDAPRRSLNYRPASDRSLPLTPESKVTRYNNFYEFGVDKSAPADNAQQLRTSPWTLTIDGLVRQPLTLDVDLLLKGMLEERIYRLRCVEAWSMVIPWLGIPLRALLDKIEILGSARYVAFETLYDPEQMSGQRSRFAGGGLRWPYVEGLRLDEALHPLTFMAMGLYGRTLPPQNGAPIRLVVPWKYGFKSIKSIVRISLVEQQPPTTWNQMAPQEYGFYANVNPQVDHPRWSQAQERVIDGAGLLGQKQQPTLMFNGYGDAVASLYQGMDLRRYY